MESIRSVSGGFRSGGGQFGAAVAPERAATAAFEAILMQSVFAPVAKAMGFYGDVVVAEATRALEHAP